MKRRQFLELLAAGAIGGPSILKMESPSKQLDDAIVKAGPKRINEYRLWKIHTPGGIVYSFTNADVKKGQMMVWNADGSVEPI